MTTSDGQPVQGSAARCVRAEPHDAHGWYAGHEGEPIRCPGVTDAPPGDPEEEIVSWLN